MFTSKWFLFIGDAIAIALVTIVGFIFHGATDVSIFPRFLLSFIPLTISWFLLAPWFGLFQTEITSDSKQLWRPALAVLFAAPLAALLRAIILNSAVIPIFAIILGATSALGMMIWREIFILLNRKGREVR